MKNNKLLKHKTREKIYYFIADHPGVHLREIFRKLDCSEGTVRYHLKYLLKNKLIIKMAVERYTRYYTTTFIEDEERLFIHFFRRTVTRNIILYLLVCGFGTQYELSKNLEKKPSTINFHIKRLLKKDIIEKAPLKDGLIQFRFKNPQILEYYPKASEKVYKLKDSEKIYKFLIKYRDKLFDDKTKEAIFELLKMFVYNKKTSKMRKIESTFDDSYDLIKEIFPPF
jgi:predicted transcriptional regulator